MTMLPDTEVEIDFDAELKKLIQEETDVPWECVVHDDPVSTMEHVVRVFVDYFGFSVVKATKLMLKVHKEGQAVVAQGTLDEMETHMKAMHSYMLQSTVRKTH